MTRVCTRTSAPPQPESPRQLVHDPSSAAWVVEVSLRADFSEGTVVLLLDRDGWLLTSVVVDGAPSDGNPKPLLDILEQLCTDQHSDQPIGGLIIALIRPGVPGAREVRPAEAQALHESGIRLERLGVPLLDVLLFDPAEWASLRVAAGDPADTLGY